jgi:EmrB/QacA subfamily drug resistance transporter
MTRTQRWSMVAVILGSSIVFLDGTIVNQALPRIGRELPATLVGTLEGQTYVGSGYLATLAALLILAGALADYYGRRRIFAIGLAGFGITSVLCGTAPTLELLVVFRILQGVAGALLIPGSIAIITALFDGPARARAFGIWAAATSATTLIAPFVGGTIVDNVGWRVAFLINIPLIVPALWATLTKMPETRDQAASGRFDWLGAVVAALAVGGISFGTIRGQEQRWHDPVAFAAIGIGLASLVAFPILMARRPNPLVPLSLFRIRRFAIINLSTLLIYAALYVNLGFQALLLQNVLGYTATASGAIGLPVGIMLTLFSARVGTIAGRIGARGFLTVGPLLMAAALLWLARIPADSTPWRALINDPASLVPPASTLVDVLPSMLLFGVGITLVVAPLTSTLMSAVPVHNAGVASAINNAISRVGQPIVAALVFIVISGTFYAALAAATGMDVSDPSLRAAVQPLNPPAQTVSPELRAAARIASTQAFHVAALVSGGLLVAGAIVNYVGLGGDRANQATSDQPPEPGRAASSAPADAGPGTG